MYSVELTASEMALITKALAYCAYSQSYATGLKDIRNKKAYLKSSLESIKVLEKFKAIVTRELKANNIQSKPWVEPPQKGERKWHGQK
jgi:hypothetical protein